MRVFTLFLVSGFIGNGIARCIFTRDFGKQLYQKIESYLRNPFCKIQGVAESDGHSKSANSYELRSPEFPRTPSAARPEYFTIFGRDDENNNNPSEPIESGFNELWLKDFRLLYPSEFQGFTESEGRSKSAIFRRDEISYENEQMDDGEVPWDFIRPNELFRVPFYNQRNRTFSNYQGFQGVAESEGRSKSAIFGRDAVSYKNVKYSGERSSQEYEETPEAKPSEFTEFIARNQTPTNYVLRSFLVLLPLRVRSTSQFAEYGGRSKLFLTDPPQVNFLFI
jgi:hypothetical protein